MTEETTDTFVQRVTEGLETYEFTFEEDPDYFSKPSININDALKSPLQYFAFPPSPSVTYRIPFTPTTPLTKRSLHHNISANASNSKSTNLMNDDEISNLMTDQSRLMSMWSAGFTIVNIYLGLGLLSYPYAVSQGGIISFIILGFICIFMSWTGKILVRCFIRMRPLKRTYTDVGYASFGKYGSVLISFGIILEFFGGICTNFIFLWNNTIYFINSLQSEHIDVGNSDNMFIISLICCAVLLPTIWILNLDELSFISFLGCICKILTVVSIVFCFMLNIHSVKDNISDHEISMYPKDLQSLSVCLGIFILSFAGHPVLPSVYNSMKEPERFETLLDRCFLCLFVIYCVMGLFGYLQFAEDTNVIITENLIKMDNVKGVELYLSQVLVVFIMFGLYFQISPLLSLLAEIPEVIVFNIESKLKQRIFRTLLFIFCAAFSYTIMNYLAMLEAITGSMCTMITSVICPSLFYFAIYTNYITRDIRVVLIFCALFGVVFGFFLLFNDLQSLFN